MKKKIKAFFESLELDTDISDNIREDETEL